MPTFIYTTFTLPTDKNYEEFRKLPKTERIEASGILEADAEFERRHGVNPARYKGHTPPISVRKERLSALEEKAFQLDLLTQE